MHARSLHLPAAGVGLALIVCAAIGAVGASSPAASDFHTLAPCRLVDTRRPDGPFGGPALSAGAARSFDLTAAGCGVPAEASAVSLNLTAVAPSTAGSITVFPGTGAPPGTNTVSFVAAGTRAGSAIVGVVSGTLSVASVQATGTVHLVLDVNGYFAPPAPPTPTATPTPTLTPTPTPTPTATLTPTPTPVPDLATWLSSHPDVAAAIRWQFQPADMVTYNSYAPPRDKDKIAWAAWSDQQKLDLETAYLDAKAWLEAGGAQPAMPVGGLSDEPANQNFQKSTDALTTSQWVTPSYMWSLYVAHVGFALALETGRATPWSLADDAPETLRNFFDSTVMGWYVPNGNYTMGTYMVPALRADNRPQTAFAPPAWTYAFLRDAGLVGATRLETIGNVLQWMRLNLWHFYGPATFGNYAAVWQYRGWVPLSKIVNGTIDANNPGLGVGHWTAGCHGSVGFLHEVLRVVNVPVEPVWIAGHELAYFTSERKYLDHGDDPYNAVVRSYPASPILGLLIDEATYQAWFSADVTVNVTDPYSPALANVGRSAANFH